MSAIGMPPHILGYFQSRPPLEFMKLPTKRKMPPISGLCDFFTSDLFEKEKPQPLPPFEYPRERRLRLKSLKLEAYKENQIELVKAYDPHTYVKPSYLKQEEEPCEETNSDDERKRRKLRKTKNEGFTGDPYRTLFVARISYDCSEKKLKKEFEYFGPIRFVRMPKDKNGKPRGYAFLEYEHDRDMKEAYKEADGKKIEGRRVLVDVERARTVSGWLPRRLGGGRGPPRGANTTPKKIDAIKPSYTPANRYTVLKIEPKRRGEGHSRKEKSEKRPRSSSRSRSPHARKR